MQQQSTSYLTQRAASLSSSKLGSPNGRMGGTVYLDMIVLASPLVLGFVLHAYSYYAIVGTLLWFGLRQIHRLFQPDPLDLLAFLSVLIVVVSPYWHSWNPSAEARSAASVAALTVAYFLPIKWFIANSNERFIGLARFLVAIGVGLSVVVLAGGVAAQIANTVSSRLAVDFTNANYASAALATSATISMLLASLPGLNTKMRAIYLIAFCVQIVSIFYLGSRASLAGVIIASGVVLFCTRIPRFARGTAFLTIVVAFISGWFPRELAAISAAVAAPLSQFGSLARGQQELADGAGRLHLWERSAQAIEMSPWIGWGPGNYSVIANMGGLHAHSWGLEIVASVGYFGALFVFLLIGLAYWKNAPQPKLSTSSGAIWNATTAVALVPNIALTAHTWTPWAWIVVSLWGCSYLLDQHVAPPDSKRVNPTLEQIEKSHK
jgi:O-antigen ligase